MIRNSKNGFTLVELVIVIAVIGVLAATLIPTFSDVLTKSKISASRSEAKSLSLLLVSKAIEQDVGYFTPDKVVEIANENGYSLKSNVDNYSYWYDASVNQLFFDKTSNVISNDYNSPVKVNTQSAGTMDVADYAITVESLSPSLPNLYFVEQGNSSIRNAINTIYSLTSDENNNNYEQMDLKLSNAISKITGDKFEKIRDFLGGFYTSNTIYFSNNGIVCNPSNVTKEYKFAVITNEIDTLASNAEFGEGVKVENKILIPSYVSVIEENAFGKLESGVIINSNVVITGSGEIGENITKEEISPNVIRGQELQLHYEYNTFDTQKNAVILVDENDELLIEGSVKKEKNILVDSGMGLGVVSDYNEKAEITLSQNDILREYLIPRLALNTEEFASKLDLTKGLMSLNNVNYENCVEQKVLIVDKDYNVYRLDSVGYVTKVGLEYVAYNNRSEQEVLLTIGKASSFDNLKNAVIEIEYQVGYLEYSHVNSYFVATGYERWNSTFSTKTINISDFGGLDSLKISLLNGESLDGNICNSANITKISIKKDSTLWYVANYSHKVNVGEYNIVVNYYLNDSDVTEDNKYYEQGLMSGKSALIKAPVPTKLGYVFGGWKVVNGTKQYANGDWINCTENLKVVAQWYASTFTFVFKVKNAGGAYETFNMKLEYNKIYDNSDESYNYMNGEWKGKNDEKVTFNFTGNEEFSVNSLLIKLGYVEISGNADLSQLSRIIEQY